MTTPSTTKAHRLTRAGWVFVSGWVPNGKEADRVNVLLDAHRIAAEAIASTPPTRGRPKARRATERAREGG